MRLMTVSEMMLALRAPSGSDWSVKWPLWEDNRDRGHWDRSLGFSLAARRIPPARSPTRAAGGFFFMPHVMRSMFYAARSMLRVPQLFAIIKYKMGSKIKIFLDREFYSHVHIYKRGGFCLE